MIYKKDYTFVMSERLPEGKIGNCAISKKIIRRGQLIRTYSPTGYIYKDHTNAKIPIVVLTKDEEVLMSDSPLEQEGLRIPVLLARGRVLMVGLGIGLFPTLVRAYNRITQHILIVEEDENIVKLVYPHIRNRQTDIRICEGMKFLVSCKDKFDFIFIDVWGDINASLSEIKVWVDLAKPLLRSGGEVRCWLQELYNRIEHRLAEGATPLTGLPGLYDPCLVCGKTLRFDYAGLCMDCADTLGVSEAFIKG